MVKLWTKNHVNVASMRTSPIWIIVLLQKKLQGFRIMPRQACGPDHAKSSRRLGADLHLLRHHFTLNVVGQGIVDAHVNEAPDQLFRTWKMNQLVRARAAG